jgi:long-chain acyl-CoA synthetase
VSGGFRRHPRATLQGNVASPFAARLFSAIGRDSFRIGGPVDAPETLDVPSFETLTSGSSGAPRRILRSQASWIASFQGNAGLFGIGPGISVAVLGALTQSLALYGAVEGLHLGAAVHLLDGLRPDRQRVALASAGIEVLYASPAQLRLMLGPGPVLDRLRLVIIGGSKLDPVLRAALREMAPGAELREFYGAAEASFITLSDAETPEGSVGRAYPGVEIAVRDGGLIWVRSPYLFDRYAGSDPGAARWQEGWLTVGEVGSLHGGDLFLHGRAGRMVTVADQNVFPEAIEAFLMARQGVTQAAVLPVPDAARGVHLVAVLQGDARQEAEILRALRREFGVLRAPKRAIWRADWPMLASGKTDLSRLAKELDS